MAIKFSILLSILAHAALFGALVCSYPGFPAGFQARGINLELIYPPTAAGEKVIQETPQPPEASPAAPAEEKPGSVNAPENKKAGKAASRPAKKLNSGRQKAAQEGHKTDSTVAARSSGQAEARGADPQSSPPIKDAANPRPGYPELARKRGQEGKVLLRCEVDAGGKVIALSIDQSSGYRLLDEAALKSVRKWRFKAALDKGKPVGGIVIVPVEFRLR